MVESPIERLFDFHLSDDLEYADDKSKPFVIYQPIERNENEKCHDDCKDEAKNCIMDY